MNLGYIANRLLKKLRGTAIRTSDIHPSSKVESGSTLIDVRMGRHSFCGYDCTLIRCDIGSFCSIASRVSIGGSRHPMEYVSTSPAFLAHRDSIAKKYSRHPYLEAHQKCVIGSDVWIGEGAFVKGGVTIGHGSVIGMAAVVTKDVAPYEIVAGNPARVIRTRFSPEIIEELLRTEWWNLDDATLSLLAPSFIDPAEFISMAQKVLGKPCGRPERFV